MDRRKFLVGVGSASLGGSALLGSGAFSRVESQRNVSIAVAEDPDAYLGLKPLDTPNSQNYVALDENGHLYIQIDGEGDQQDLGGDGSIGQGVNSDSRTWFDGMFQVCNQGKEDACLSWEFSDDFEMRDEAELVFYYDGDGDGDPSTSGRVDVEEGRQVPLDLGECATMGLRTETFDVDATDDAPLFNGYIQLVADVDGECFEDDRPGCVEPDSSTWAIDPDPDDEGVGGPVTLLGIDTEDGAPGGHGFAEDYELLVADILDNVNNTEDGILVIGNDGEAGIGEFWDNIGGLVNENVSYVSGAGDISDTDFDDFAMLAVVTSEFNEAIGSNQDLLSNAENDELVTRADDIAEFVNDGGGLLVSSQTDLDNEWGLVGGLNTFVTITGLSYSEIQPTEDGQAVGLGDPDTGDSDLDLCCWHDTFTNAPDFLDVLAWREGYGEGSATADEIPDGNEAAALGGEAAVLPVTINIAVEGYANVGVSETESYDVTVSNIGEEPGEQVEIQVAATGSGTVDVVDLPTDPFTLEQDFEETYTDAFEVTCDDEGLLDVQVSIVGTDTGDTLAEITAEIECIPDAPGIC